VSPAEHHARRAGDFAHRADQVTDWDAPAPVDGWVARDVVDHLVSWLPAFLAGGGIVLESNWPAVADDPAGAWHAHAGAVQALLDGPDAGAEFSHPQVGSHRVDAAIDQFYTTDVFLHTWDLSRASGQDPDLDPEFAAQLLAGMQPIDEMLRQSGQYGPRVPVPADAPVADQLIGFIGRDPGWRPPTS
jgi:uncharacterized protein (TIGR03086 family)